MGLLHTPVPMTPQTGTVKMISRIPARRIKKGEEPLRGPGQEKRLPAGGIGQLVVTVANRLLTVPLHAGIGPGAYVVEEEAASLM